jgi:diguanylate cyclase (GGDEF)-like protein
LVAASGLLAYNPSLDERSGSGAQQKLTSPLIQLRAVTQVYASGKRTGWPLNPTSPVVVPKGEFSLRFEFALPDYSLERGRRYKGQLIGHDTIAGDWSLSRQYTYGGLSAGDYRLELAGKDVQGNVTAIAPYEFTVTPPWWATIWARLFAATAALTGLGFLIRWGVHRRTALLAKQNEALEAKVAARTSELTNANQQLDRMAHVDGLTGIANRRALDGAMSTAWTRAQSQNEPISVFVIDVDLFKRYNDTYGHLAGDELLKRIAGALKPCLHRPQDLIARYGGEEFVVLMPGASLIVAMRAAEEMREAVAQSDMGVTISIGVATYTPDPTRGETPSDVIKRADDALYAAKHRGRNQVVSGD